MIGDIVPAIALAPAISFTCIAFLIYQAGLLRDHSNP